MERNWPFNSFKDYYRSSTDYYYIETNICAYLIGCSHARNHLIELRKLTGKDMAIIKGYWEAANSNPPEAGVSFLNQANTI